MGGRGINDVGWVRYSPTRGPKSCLALNGQTSCNILGAHPSEHTWNRNRETRQVISNLQEIPQKHGNSYVGGQLTEQSVSQPSQKSKSTAATHRAPSFVMLILSEEEGGSFFENFSLWREPNINLGQQKGIPAPRCAAN